MPGWRTTCSRTPPGPSVLAAGPSAALYRAACSGLHRPTAVSPPWARRPRADDITGGSKLVNRRADCIIGQRTCQGRAMSDVCNSPAGADLMAAAPTRRALLLTSALRPSGATSGSALWSAAAAVMRRGQPWRSPMCRALALRVLSAYSTVCLPRTEPVRGALARSGADGIIHLGQDGQASARMLSTGSRAWTMESETTVSALPRKQRTSSGWKGLSHRLSSAGASGWKVRVSSRQRGPF